jgi:transposase
VEVKTLDEHKRLFWRHFQHQYQTTFDYYIGSNGSMGKKTPYSIPEDNSRFNDEREKKAKQILLKEKAIRKVDRGLYLVQSQKGNGWYRVQWNGKNWICDCKDFDKNGQLGPCKHIIALKLKWIGYVSIPGKEPIVEKKTYTQDWATYNQAQVQEFELFDKLLFNLVSDIEEPEHVGAGRPPLKRSDQIFCSVMKVYSMLSSRRAQWLYLEAVQRNQIDHAPHFNVVSKALNKKEITPILYNLIRLTAQPLSSIESDFAVDSSGFRCSSFGQYCEEKHGSKRMRNWLKAHICIGVSTNIVTDIVVTDEHAADSNQFPKLIENTSDYFIIKEVSADPAYSSAKNHEIVDDLGAKAFILFKKNATGKNRGRLWRKAYHYFQLNKDEFLEHYHKRSNAETTFSAIKMKFGETIKSRNRVAQENELLCKIIAYNITVLIRKIIEINVDFELFSLTHITGINLQDDNDIIDK